MTFYNNAFKNCTNYDKLLTLQFDHSNLNKNKHEDENRQCEQKKCKSLSAVAAIAGFHIVPPQSFHIC